MKIKQSRSELLAHLDEQLQFIRASSSAFDAGYVGEAKRLAVAVRVLFHDTKNPKSLLGLLKVKKGVGFFDSSFNLDKKNQVSHLGLVGTEFSGGTATHNAFLSRKVEGQLNKYVFFPEWWNRNVIKDNNKNSFTRMDLVLVFGLKVRVNIGLSVMLKTIA